MGTYDSIDLLVADWCWGIVIIHVGIWGESVLLYSEFVTVLSGITSFHVETDNSCPVNTGIYTFFHMSIYASFKKYMKMPDNMWNCYYQFMFTLKCLKADAALTQIGPM
ncbi:unnamed protein product [Prunus brigantina]